MDNKDYSMPWYTWPTVIGVCLIFPPLIFVVASVALVCLVLWLIPKKDESKQDDFGSGFNPNVVRRGGVACSVNTHSIRTETAEVKAASQEAIKRLKLIRRTDKDILH
jgi:hypothetical protein